MITVHVFGNAPPPVHGITRDLRALWALEESGLPYRVRPLDFARGELRAAEHLRVNPFGHLPSIDDDGFRLFESAAIVLYVLDKAGRLVPGDAQRRAVALQWAFAAVNTVEPAMAELFGIDQFSSDQAWAKERRPAVVERVKTVLAILDGELTGRSYLMGAEFSAPDILMATVLRLVQHTDLLGAVTHVAAYRARCEERPAWKKILAAYEQRLAA